MSDLKQVSVISLVVPTYNEEAAIDPFVEKAVSVFAARPDLELEMVFVNDGSQDKTLSRLRAAQERYDGIRIVDLSRNFGKEAALSAGLAHAEGDAVVPIDVDLQHPIETVPEMVGVWREGSEVVLARHIDRTYEPIARRLSAKMFYAIHNRVSDVELPIDAGDFRLMDRKVVQALREFPETRRFMKGLFAWAGFRVGEVTYETRIREHGKSRFRLWGLWNLALEGITSFSTALLRIWTYIGLLVALIAFAYAAWIIFEVFVSGVDVPGYASLAVLVMVFGGLNMIGIGILGEYLGRTYIESKRRPIYIVRNVF